MTKDKKIAIIGSGPIGNVLGKVLHDKGFKDITIFTKDLEEAAELAKGTNTKYFPNSEELPIFKIVHDLRIAIKDVDYILVTGSVKFIHVLFGQICGTIDEEVLVFNITSGFYPGTELTVQAGLEIEAKRNKYIRGVVSLAGPAHPSEIIQRQPTIVSALNSNMELCLEAQELFQNDYFKVIPQTDVIGAEVSAAYNKVIATAAGIVYGLGYGTNTNAGLITRGINEMITFGKAMHGKKDTIMGISGIGGLIGSATTKKSPSFSLGVELTKDHIDEVLENNVFYEGILALKFIIEMARKKHLDLPIAFALDKVMHENGNVKDFVTNIWKLEMK